MGTVSRWLKKIIKETKKAKRNVQDGNLKAGMRFMRRAKDGFKNGLNAFLVEHEGYPKKYVRILNELELDLNNMFLEKWVIEEEQVKEFLKDLEFYLGKVMFFPVATSHDFDRCLEIAQTSNQGLKELLKKIKVLKHSNPEQLLRGLKKLAKIFYSVIDINLAYTIPISDKKYLSLVSKGNHEELNAEFSKIRTMEWQNKVVPMFNVAEKLKKELNSIFSRKERLPTTEEMLAFFDRVLELESEELLVDNDYKQLERILKKDFYTVPRDKGTITISHGTESYNNILKSGFIRQGGKYFDEEKAYFITAMFKFRLKLFGKCHENFFPKEEFIQVLEHIKENNEPFVRYYCERYGQESLDRAFEHMIKKKTSFNKIYNIFQNGVSWDGFRHISTYFYNGEVKQSTHGRINFNLKVPNKLIVGGGKTREACLSFFPISLKYCYRIVYRKDSTESLAELPKVKKILNKRYPWIKFVIID